MKKLIGKFLLSIMGWKLDITVPVGNIPKCVLIAAPHTSNWDFYYAISAFWAMGIPMKFFIKDSWTKPWYGIFIKALGGIGINRSQRSDMVTFAATQLKNHDRLYMLNTPEGSRSYAEKWKTGFYYIAQEANVPILLSYADYHKKMAGIGKVIELKNKSKEEILQEIEEYYQNIQGKFPENYNPKIY